MLPAFLLLANPLAVHAQGATHRGSVDSSSPVSGHCRFSLYLDFPLDTVHDVIAGWNLVSAPATLSQHAKKEERTDARIGASRSTASCTQG